MSIGVAFVNCTIISRDINVDIRGTDNSDVKHTLSFDNCYVEASPYCTGQNSYAIYGNHGKTADWNITINNSKLVNKNNNKTAGNPNCVIGLHNAGDINLDIKGNTVIEAATNSNTYGNYGIGVFQAANVSLKLASTVTIELNVPDNLDVVSNFISLNKGTMDGNNASPIYTHYDNQCGDINWVINVNNSTLAQEGTNISSYDSVITAHTGENLEINITGNSVLNVAGGTTSNAASKNHYAIYVANSHSDNNVSINIDPTVEITANVPNTTTAGNVIFIQAPANAVINNDAEMSANARAMALGVILPTQSADAGDKFLGWTDGATLIKAGAAYTSDADTTFAPVYYLATDYGMIAGASLRTKANENGIRFTSYVTDSFLAKLEQYGASVSFGTLIASNALLGENELVIALATGTEDSVAVNIANSRFHTDFTNSGKVYDNAMHAAVIMPEGVVAYELELAARGYMTVIYANGTGVIYTDFNADDNVRSMLEVAEFLNETGNYDDNEVVQGIIEACTPTVEA